LEDHPKKERPESLSARSYFFLKMANHAAETMAKSIMKKEKISELWYGICARIPAAATVETKTFTKLISFRFYLFTGILYHTFLKKSIVFS
jgi:hypothetical protein